VSSPRYRVIQWGTGNTGQRALREVIRHPALGMTDVPAGTIAGLTFQPTLHVHYGEKVLAVRDGLPKFKDFPDAFGGSNETMAE